MVNGGRFRVGANNQCPKCRGGSCKFCNGSVIGSRKFLCVNQTDTSCGDNEDCDNGSARQTGHHLYVLPWGGMRGLSRSWA